MLVILAVLVVAAGLLLLLRRTDGPADPRTEDDVDHAELEEAEREVRDLDASVSPDEADDHLPDWGPGAPK